MAKCGIEMMGYILGIFGIILLVILVIVLFPSFKSKQFEGVLVAKEPDSIYLPKPPMRIYGCRITLENDIVRITQFIKQDCGELVVGERYKTKYRFVTK